MDVFHSFGQLAANRTYGRDYRTWVGKHATRVAILAPHGGGIEPGTLEVARAIAGLTPPRHASYLFEALQPQSNQQLHIASTCFDDPDCLALIRSSAVVLAIHGCQGGSPCVSIGGLDHELGSKLLTGFDHAGFKALPDESQHAGCDPRNICNRGASGRGVQLELSEGLRRSFFEGFGRANRRRTTLDFKRFVVTVRDVLLITTITTF